ncbi:MAG TPA: HAMP domain-containing protein, partial [Thermoanaerobaculia bacterium]|nr:HAMP domain-containing protein [Thermoanaerobaculia bacterium]
MKATFTRDNRILIALGLALGAALTGLYALVQRARALSPAAATSRVLLFFLFYIVVLLILALLFVLVRSGVRLLLESRRGVFGTRFRVRVVATHVGLALLPIALLILPTSRLLVRSVEQWFAPPVAETVRSGRVVAEMVRQKNAALEARTAERLRASLSSSDAEHVAAALTKAREESGLDFLEWLPNGAAAVAVSSPRWPVRDVNDPGLEWITDAKSRGAARRIEPTPDGGQVGRTLVAVPGGLLVMGTYEPVEEAGPLRSLTRATSDYAMLQAERASLAAVQVLLFLLLALLVLLAAVWAGLLLARRVTRPIAALAASARRVGAGDFDALVEVEGGDEIAALSGAFNAMTSELKTNRERIVAATEEMAVTNRRLDEERKRVKTILSHLGAGVIAFREDGRLLFTNDAARDILGVEESATTLEALLGAAPLAPLLSFLEAAREEGPHESTLTLHTEGGARVVEARIVRVPMEDEKR